MDLDRIVNEDGTFYEKTPVTREYFTSLAQGLQDHKQRIIDHQIKENAQWEAEKAEIDQ